MNQHSLLPAESSRSKQPAELRPWVCAMTQAERPSTVPSPLFRQRGTVRENLRGSIVPFLAAGVVGRFAVCFVSSSWVSVFFLVLLFAAPP